MRVNLSGEGEELVRDVRLDKVYTHLSKMVEFPEGLGFATRIQDAIPATDPNVEKDQPDLALFIITSPHPKAGKSGTVYKAGHLIISVAEMPLIRWREADAEWRHYAGLADPLRPIFAGLLRQHMDKRKQLEAISN